MILRFACELANGCRCVEGRRGGGLLELVSLQRIGSYFCGRELIYCSRQERDLRHADSKRKREMNKDEICGNEIIPVRGNIQEGTRNFFNSIIIYNFLTF
jgi:hypothetical protein